MHVITVLREYLGLNQCELAKRARLSQCDISEMEHLKPYGAISKYEKLAAALGVSVHCLVTNNCARVPLSFFETHNHAPYLEESARKGWDGEETVFEMEKERLMSISPSLASLIIPYYKVKQQPPGYDILSFNDQGQPVAIEVKTSVSDADSDFRLTTREYNVAKKMTEKGEIYLVYRFTNWGSENQKLHIMPFLDMMNGARVTPAYYTCIMKDRTTQLSGIAFHRRRRGLTQKMLATEIGILPDVLCQYETRERKCMVPTYQKLAEALEVTVDELLETYPVSALQ